MYKRQLPENARGQAEGRACPGGGRFRAASERLSEGAPERPAVYERDCREAEARPHGQVGDLPLHKDALDTQQENAGEKAMERPMNPQHGAGVEGPHSEDRKSTRLNSSH